MDHAIRVEEKENGIRTCVICPGLVETEILKKRPVKTPAETLEKAMQPEDVAEVVLSVAKLPRLEPSCLNCVWNQRTSEDQVCGIRVKKYRAFP